VNDTHQQDNLSIPPHLDRRNAPPVTRDGALIPAQVLTLTRRINALVEKGDRAAEKAEQFYKAAGIHIKEIKQRESEHWEAIVRDKCGLGRSRAYELMAIADGKTTLEKVRADTNERKKVHRAKPESVPERTEPAVVARATGSAEISVEQRQADMARLGGPDETGVDEVDKRIDCVTKTILRHVDGLTRNDGARFFAALRDRIDDPEREALRADETLQ
jgi:hypothetical protein